MKPSLQPAPRLSTGARPGGLAEACTKSCGGEIEPIVTMSALGVIESANDEVEEILGWNPSELEGRRLSMLMPEPHRFAFEAALARLATAGSDQTEPQAQRVPVIRRDGTVVACELAITRFELPDHAEPFFTASLHCAPASQRDAHAWKASDEILSAIFDNEYQHRCIVSSSGQVLRVNQTCLAAMSMERDQVLGHALWDLPWWGSSPARRKEVREAVAQAAEGKTLRYEFDLHTATRGLMRADLVLIPIRDPQGEVRFIFFEARNVTREREVEEAERTMLQSFAEIGESAAEVLHEIKNPISGIHLALRVLAKELKQDERAVLEELASRLSQLESRLRRTLQFARPAKAQRLPLSATAVLNRAIEGVRPAATGWSIAIESEVPAQDVRFYGDPALLHEALVNLLLNALECGTTRIRAGAREDGSRVSFVVEDAGPGVPVERIDSIFKPFITTKPHGNGIGLSLVRKAAETHGGSISVDRGALGGARFTLVVPAHTKVGFYDAG